MLSDGFVDFLAIATFSNGLHQELFTGHEGQFCFEIATNRFGVDDQACQDVSHDVQASIQCEEGLWEDQSTVG